MAASRRAWQTAARTDDPGEPAGGGEGHESSDPATTRPSMPEEENSNSAEGPMPPDPWTEWILRHREFEGHPPPRREGHLPGSFGVYSPLEMNLVRDMIHLRADAIATGGCPMGSCATPRP